MIRSCDEDDGFDNNFSFILRNSEYKKEIYQIKEEIKQNVNLYKLYGYNRERNSNIVITKVMNLSERENPNFLKRLLTTIKLIEENKLLVENLWLEKTYSNSYDLYVSEFTNTIYRNEYNLITLNNYMSSTKNTYKDNIQILILIVRTMLYFQKYDFPHLNLHPNNIYINIQQSNLIYFGPPKIVKNYTNDSTYLWYSSPEDNFVENNYNDSNDIWSLGCIICELFFINFPLFQAYSPNEKIMKIIDILGFPSYNDVDYMNKYQYDSLFKSCLNHSKENNLFNLLLSSKEEKSNLYKFKVELIDIIKGCLDYNIKKRLELEEILHRLEYLNNNISSEFHTQILDTINVTEESESNNSKLENNYNLKNIINNKSIDIEEYKEPNIENRIIFKEKYYTINSISKNQNINNIKIIQDDLKKDNNDKKKNIKEQDVNNILFKKESNKKENVIDYGEKNNNIKDKDEYKELYKSK